MSKIGDFGGMAKLAGLITNWGVDTSLETINDRFPRKCPKTRIVDT